MVAKKGSKQEVKMRGMTRTGVQAGGRSPQRRSVKSKGLRPASQAEYIRELDQVRNASQLLGRDMEVMAYNRRQPVAFGPNKVIRMPKFTVAKEPRSNPSPFPMAQPSKPRKP
jgi:hypothetical protein